MLSTFPFDILRDIEKNTIQLSVMVLFLLYFAIEFR